MPPPANPHGYQHAFRIRSDDRYVAGFARIGPLQRTPGVVAMRSGAGGGVRRCPATPSRTRSTSAAA